MRESKPAVVEEPGSGFTLCLSDCVAAAAYLKGRAPEEADEIERTVISLGGTGPGWPDLRALPLAQALIRLIGEGRFHHYERPGNGYCGTRTPSDFAIQFGELYSLLGDYCAPVLESGVTGAVESSRDGFSAAVTASGFATLGLVGERFRLSLAVPGDGPEGKLVDLGLRDPVRKRTRPCASGSVRFPLSSEDILLLEAARARNGFLFITRDSRKGGGWLFPIGEDGERRAAYATDFGAFTWESFSSGTPGRSEGPRMPILEADPEVRLPPELFPIFLRHFRRIGARSDRDFITLFMREWRKGGVTGFEPEAEGSR